jgi:hypothetical protein
MKKLIATLLLVIGATVIMPASTFAAAATTDVTGEVTYNGSLVKGAEVTAVCDGKSKSAKTNSTGQYLITFTSKQCPNGATVNVSASATVSSKNETGNNHGKVNPYDNSTILNIAVVNVTLPEFGLLTATGAALLGSGAFLLVRRHQIRATNK